MIWLGNPHSDSIMAMDIFLGTSPYPLPASVESVIILFPIGGICFLVPWRVVFDVHSVSQAERAVSILKGLGEKCC